MNNYLILEKKKVLFFFSIVTFLLMLSNPSESLAWSGKVIDRETGEPIEGAVIVRSWDRETATPAGSVSSFEDVKEVISDKNGKFTTYRKFFFSSIPFLSQVVENKPIIYKPGYKFLILEDKDSIIYLEKVPTKLDVRKSELDKAEGNYEIDRYETMVFKRMLEREDEFIRFREHAKMYGLLKNRRQLGLEERRRMKASQYYLKAKGPDFYKPLIANLKDHDEFTRSRSAQSLKVSSDPEVVKALIDTLNNDESMNVRSSAARSLGEIGDPIAIKPLIKALRNKSEVLQNHVIFALTDIGDAADDDLIPLLNDDDWVVRKNAARFLYHSENDRALDALIKASNDKNPNVLISIAIALGEFRDSRAVETLIIMLKNDDREVRRRAAFGLGMIQDTRAIKPLTGLLEDPEWSVREGAVEALGMMKDRRVVEVLIEAWNNEDSDVRIIAAEVLVDFGSLAVEPLIDLLKHDDSYFRWRAAWALGQIGDPKAIENLTHLLQDDVSEVRFITTEALKYINRKKDVRPNYYDRTD
ncbi:MAG: HEAT repeat domain-containing protein [Nitrospirae bacterium]|nr:HEAT repeat domain-containing protein [Nitrospirota bacterium]